MTNIRTERIDYPVDGRTHRGYLAVDGSDVGERPGVMVVHEWWGLNDHVEGRARLLAELGYAAFAVDMYGDGSTADNPDDAASLMNAVLNDMRAGTARLRAAFETLCERPEADAANVGAVGHCFGGAMALHMARIGMPLKAVVSFHGALGSFHEPSPGEVKARVLVCHGAADAMVSDADVAAFKAEMEAAGAAFEVIAYDGAQHGFTNPAATERGRRYGLPLAYDAEADRASWEAMKGLFASVFE